MTLPNFLVVGAAKAGTTALYHYLKQHPQVYMGPNKETNFFVFEGLKPDFCGPGDEEICRSAVVSLDEYEEQFRDVSGESAIGEASPWYLYRDRAATNIKRHIPDAKIIVVLRNPVDRAFSSYLHVVRDGRETLSFEDGLLAEDERVARGWEFIWHYQRTGFYAAQVGRYLDLFPREQLRFFLYDDFLSAPDRFLKDVCGFLGVDTDFEVDTSIRPNATGIPKNRLLGQLVLRPNPLKSTIKFVLPKRLRYNAGQRINRLLLEKPSLDPNTRMYLLNRYRDDILKLQDLVDLDLSMWTK